VWRLNLSEGSFGWTPTLSGGGIHPDVAQGPGLETFQERSREWIFLSIYPSP
jgi:hypothetical protein